MNPTDQMYENMAKHPDAGQVMDLLAIVEPCDEFSMALCLVRDCFSPNTTLRTLSRKKLRGVLKERLALLRAYESAMKEAETETEQDEAREAFRRQVNALMGRPLNPASGDSFNV